MPFSNPVHRGVIRDWFVKHWPRGKKVIDVGPGAGAYADLLSDNYTMVCIEAFGRYVGDYKLFEKYKQVIVADVRNIGAETFIGAVVVMGDMLEHLSVSDAQREIEKIKSTCDALVVVVPYMYAQDEHHPDVLRFGNPHEVHLQPDLTHEVFQERYPGFEIIARSNEIGAYVWRPS